MIKFQIISGGSQHIFKPEKRVLGDRYADDVAISVEKPYEERDSVCVMVVLHDDEIVDLVPILDAPVTLGTNITQYKRVFVKFNFIRLDGTIKDSTPCRLLFMPAETPEDFTPDDPFMETLAETIEEKYTVSAALNDYALTLAALTGQSVATVDYSGYITEIGEYLAAIREEYDESQAALLDEAEDYADDKAAGALADAKTYADGKDAETLTSAKNYTDSKAADLQGQIDTLVNDLEYDNIFAAMLDDTNTSRVFVDWYKTVKTEGITRFEMLKRFFKMCALNNNATHTVRFLSPSVSSESRGTPLDDLADKKAQILETDAGVVASGNSWLDASGASRTDGEDWATENRLTWYVRANALSLENGDMNVVAIEGIDADFDITGETAPVYTFQMSPYYKETDDGSYLVKSWRANPADGYAPFNDNIDLNGVARPLTWHATFGGSMTTSGNKLTSGANRHPKTFTSAETGNGYARNWSVHEGVGADASAKWALSEWQHRHFNLENSNIAEGCLDYNYQFKVALTESDVRRVLLSTSDGANFVVGSNVYVGDNGSSSTAPDRTNDNSRNKSGGFAKILSKETVNISDTDYVALNLELSADITTTATTWVSTAPWDTGATESLGGHADGSPVSLTSGKYPLRIAGMEVLIGCYFIGLDMLYQTTSASGGYNYKVYECKNSNKYASSVTSDYTDTGITFSALPSGWNYVKKYKITSKPILFPDTIGGSSTGYLKSAFSGTFSAGVRGPWRFGRLSGGGAGGLACGTGSSDPSNSHWYGAPWLAGAEKKRGELAG